MTALVGVLNKNAIAIAADSAATYNITRSNKVLNTANKIFNISKYEPVGVMIYNNSSLMGTPWEIIFKLYRESLGHKTFDNLELYIVDFYSFLKENDFFAPVEVQKECLCNEVVNYLNTAINNVESKIKNVNLLIPQQVRIDEYINYFREELSRSDKYICSSLDSFLPIDKFTIFVQEIIIKVLNESNLLDEDNRLMPVLIDALFHYFENRDIIFSSFSGLVFCGYGKKEIFPSIIEYRVYYGIGGFLRSRVVIKSSISHNLASIIMPFAQTDVMFSLLTGIDNDILNAIYKFNNKALRNYHTEILNELLKMNVDDSIIQAIIGKNIQSYSDYFANVLNQYMKDEYIDKLTSTVTHLGKEDLANLAESLIALTGLKKRITSAEETVGGPVDVAILSKSDGFIWIRRKHYFDKELNSQFFARYNI